MNLTDYLGEITRRSAALADAVRQLQALGPPVVPSAATGGCCPAVCNEMVPV